jgi:hypothetical protein
MNLLEMDLAQALLFAVTAGVGWHMGKELMLLCMEFGGSVGEIVTKGLVKKRK